MTRIATHLSMTILAALALTAAAPASLARAEGNGVKFGEGRVHPYFMLETRFDSAAAMVLGDSGNYVVAGDLLLHFKPGLKFEMPSPTFAVGLNANLDYALYTGMIQSGTSTASRLQGEADLDLGINRSGNIGVDIGDHVVRSDRSLTPVISVGVLSLYNDARIKLNIRPSGGAVTIEPGYHLTTEFFSGFGEGGVVPPGCSGSACDPGAVGSLDYLQHTAALTGRWKFLPKTAMLLDAAFGLRQYTNGGGTPISTLKASLGLGGLLTTHFSTILKLGWGQDFTTSSYSSLIAHAEAAYLLSETAQIRGGYVRNFEPVGGGYVSYGDDRVYVDGRMLLGGKVTAHGYTAFDFIGFNGGAAERSDTSITLDLGADYEIRPWITVGGGYTLSFRKSPGGTGVLGLSNFTRNEVYTRAQVIY